MRCVRPPGSRSQTWSTFLRNHSADIWACDFLQLYDFFFRPIFAFFLVAHESREVIHFDVTRRPNEHLAFGVGEHYCLGANLARMELQEIFRGVLSRLPDLELASTPRRLRSNFINGVKEMRVRFTPQAKAA